MTRFASFAFFGLLVVSGALVSGCTLEEPDLDPDDAGTTCDEPNPDVMAVAIDSGARLDDIAYGREAGVFIEHASGGTWRLFTSCDSEINGDCLWDIKAWPRCGYPLDLSSDDLEGTDDAWIQDYSVNMVVKTGSDSDGVVFTVPAGESLIVDVWLDGLPESRYVYWVGGDVVRSGAPTNPIELVPSAR